MRYKALLSLPKFTERGSDAISSALVRLLTDSNADVRRAALEVLPLLVVGEDKGVIIALRSRIQDGKVASNERRAAIWTLQKLVEKGDERALDVLSACVEDCDADVRRTAKRARLRLLQ